MREFHGSFNDVLRRFEGCLKIVSSVFQENFKKISRILLLRESHAATRADGGVCSYQPTPPYILDELVHQNTKEEWFEI